MKKYIKLLLLLFLINFYSQNSFSNDILISKLKNGGNLIFIRHAFAPGTGDPINFNINDCSTQRNINQEGKKQAKLIGLFFKKNEIPIDKVISSEWCRCKETASIAFNDEYEVNNILNSFYDEKFYANKKRQIDELKKYIKNWKGKKNLILITHYVVILEVLNMSSGSGEIVISDKNYNIINSLEKPY